MVGAFRARRRGTKRGGKTNFKLLIVFALCGALRSCVLFASSALGAKQGDGAWLSQISVFRPTGWMLSGDLQRLGAFVLYWIFVFHIPLLVKHA